MTVLSLLLLPPAAVVEVTVYGAVGGGFTVSQTTLSQGGRHSGAALADDDSHIGLRGAHALGGSSNVVWQVAQEARPKQHPESFQQYLRNRQTPDSWRFD